MDALTKLYIEATTACNLNCRMCIQRVWDEPVGFMPLALYRSIIDGLRDFGAPPTVHLGGFGEPMMHPDMLEMVRFAKAAGACVEMTTNGTLLDSDTAEALVELGLDRLVVSLDGATAAHYEHIRERAQFMQVIENLRNLYRLRIRRESRFSKPFLTIAFVAMKRNIDDLPLLARLGPTLGAGEILVSNVVPHTPEMAEEALYQKSLTACTYRESIYTPVTRLPKLDVDTRTAEPLYKLFGAATSLTLLDASLSRRNDYCQFAHEGYMVVRWDGQVSPCLSLLHTHPEYQRGRRRRIAHYALGDMNAQSVREVWESADYAAFRERLRAFRFSPCTTCGGCERFVNNAEDCTLNAFPTCGGCLWAQGFVQCP